MERAARKGRSICVLACLCLLELPFFFIFHLFLSSFIRSFLLLCLFAHCFSFRKSSVQRAACKLVCEGWLAGQKGGDIVQVNEEENLKTWQECLFLSLHTDP